MANPDDDAIENEKGVWFRSPLVGWNGWPSTGLRDAVGNNWSGGVGPKIDDIAPDEGQTFGGTLNKAQGGYVRSGPFLLLNITALTKYSSPSLIHILMSKVGGNCMVKCWQELF